MSAGDWLLLGLLAWGLLGGGGGGGRTGGANINPYPPEARNKLPTIPPKAPPPPPGGYR